MPAKCFGLLDFKAKFEDEKKCDDDANSSARAAAGGWSPGHVSQAVTLVTTKSNYCTSCLVR